VLELNNVSASYGRGAPAISGITLAVGEGQICAVLGANGAGKSTLLRAIMGLLPRVSGEIRGPGGRLLSGLPTFQVARHGVAYVPEGRGILYSLDVRENLLLGATRLQHGAPGVLEERTDRILKLFPILRERLGQRAGSLSGGQQQMLALARALLAQPRLLLLDEPSLGLAPLVRREIGVVLNRVRDEEGISIVLVEQDIKTAQACASRALVLRQGRLVDELQVADIAASERLRHAYLGIGKVHAGEAL
jgi:branched-chain amino acid transport system ATP-binding protein